ncbi:MAG: type II toxin-antitoxin system Phd/YefM family antitoxin [Candidatus Daviesbacteria bacterium]|nr:type II toxin-antitoxin system Phd/YefM family antitoxin [Candidatus Daviesbacteria bacterium]
MNLPNPKIIPISEARAKLSDLADKACGNNYFLLTRGGKPEIALVDIKYLEKLEKDLARIYQKTYIDPQLLPLTREFSDEEIKRWQEEDTI